MTQDGAEPALVAQARAGSADAFGRLVHMHQQGLRAFLRRLTRQGHAAQEVPTVLQPDPGLRLDLAKVTAALPAEQRAALLLCLACEFTHAEAADALALPLGTVKSHVARGREKLMAALGAKNE